MLGRGRILNLSGLMFYFSISISLCSDICMNETLLKSSLSKTCGIGQCDFDSYCGEDNRCLYCSNALCDAPPPGCEVSCWIRRTDSDQIYYNFRRGENQTANLSLNESKTTDHVWLLVSVAGNVVLIIVLSIIVIIQRQWIVENIPKMISKLGHWRCESNEKKTLKSIVVSNTSNAEEQTSALLVTGKDSSHVDHSNVC